MDSISTSAANEMPISHVSSREMLANNLANVETGGYKADREFYSIYTSEDASLNPHTGDISTLPVIESQWVDHSQGNIRNTSNPMDFAIDGDGLFAVQTPNGVRYTRNGTFRVSQTGVLTAARGHPVLALKRRRSSSTLRLPVEVSPDGSVNQAGQPVAQFQLSAFDPSTLNKVGLNYFEPVAGTQPRQGTGSIMQGKVEQSNVRAAGIGCPPQQAIHAPVRNASEGYEYRQ